MTTKISHTLHLYEVKLLYLNFLELCHRACHFQRVKPTLKNCRCNMSACLSFVFATLPFCGFLCLVFFSCWCLCLERACQSELMEVTRSSGFSQNSQTQLFNTSDRLHLSFYTSLLHIKTVLTVQIFS